jgi:hypothetical protein
MTTNTIEFTAAEEAWLAEQRKHDPAPAPPPKPTHRFGATNQWQIDCAAHQRRIDRPDQQRRDYLRAHPEVRERLNKAAADK